MILRELQITNLRNILSARLLFHPHLNIVSGCNGSGKTSFLESIFLLASGQSFRCHDIRSIVSHHQDTLTVFSKTDDFQRISIQKAAHQPTIALINGESCLRRSELATFLPCQVFYQDIFQLIDAGPTLRRGLLDWGLFHVEHDYHVLWKDYRRVLKQRNSLLKSRANLTQLLPWNKMLAEIACQLDKRRLSYFNRLSCEFNTIIHELTNLQCELSYYRGWDKKNEGKSLEDILLATFQSDCLRQYTHYGAHHADLIVISSDYKVKNVLSRGQQKIVLFALKFAQSRLVDKPCIYLIDDMASELDENHISRLMHYINTTKGQFFITTRQNDIPLFNIDHTNYTHYLIDNGHFGLQH
jgi:DNA replication and repair protein RecF